MSLDAAEQLEKEGVEPYKSRRFQCGMDLYGALEIGREDKDKRVEAALANYRFLAHQSRCFSSLIKSCARDHG